MMPNCRFCNAPLAHVFCDLGRSPLSNAYRTQAELESPEPFYPLRAYVCSECFLVQLEQFEAAENIFSDYAYLSSYSESWLDHCRRYVEEIQSELKLDADNLIVELASNDGYLLQYFKQHDVPVLGIEPAQNVAEIARGKGVPTRCAFFSVETASAMVAEGLSPDLLIGNNVLAHVPDLNNFVSGMQTVLREGGTITMEFPHLLRLIAENQFDTIYHEHFSYFSLTTAERVFAKHGLRIYDVKELSTHGGSLRVYACHADDPRSTEPETARVRREEEAAGLMQMNTYTKFSHAAEQTTQELLEFLPTAKNDGKSVAAYGAPAKGNTLLNYCGVRSDLVSYTVDRNPTKQGRFLPGSHIPVYPPEELERNTPDYILLLPWNIKEEILTQNQALVKKGARFVVPIPNVEVLRER